MKFSCGVPGRKGRLRRQCAVRDFSQSAPHGSGGFKDGVDGKQSGEVAVIRYHTGIFIFEGGIAVPHHLCEPVDRVQQIPRLKTAYHCRKAVFIRKEGERVGACDGCHMAGAEKAVHREVVL